MAYVVAPTLAEALMRYTEGYMTGDPNQLVCRRLSALDAFNTVVNEWGYLSDAPLGVVAMPFQPLEQEPLKPSVVKINTRVDITSD